MSKIYEALRQAEADRAKKGETSTPSSSSASRTNQAVLDPAEPMPVFSSEVRALLPLAPRAEMPAETMPVTEFSRPDASDQSTSGLTSDLRNLDLSAVQHRVWTPSLAQLPALEERGNAVEQFRSLRSRMQEFRDLNKLKSILVSSGLPQEGKSFVAVNLAISFARHKAGRVLLIDGDMRRATLHKLLGCTQGPGLTEFLAGDASLVEIMQRPTPPESGQPLPNGLASLTFIPAGTEHDKAADLSGNPRFEQLIKAAAPHFDWIVVDSSPVNLVSDGVNLARACDAVLLVARGGVTKFEVAQRAIGELKASKVLGVVLNAVKNPTVAGGYYGYDGYDKIEE
jgi:protein-tyrosine kinase